MRALEQVSDAELLDSTAPELAVRYGVHIGTVAVERRRRGLSGKQGYHTPRLAHVDDATLVNTQARVLAAQYGVARRTVYGERVRRGLKAKPLIGYKGHVRD